jgi:very-short-patch-repair endonuclease
MPVKKRASYLSYFDIPKESKKDNKKKKFAELGYDSPAELLFHEEAKKQGLDLRYGDDIDNIYRTDFTYITNKYKLDIEIDGKNWHTSKQDRLYDYVRERYLMNKGYLVFRFTGEEIFKNKTKCVIEVKEFIKKLDNSPLLLNENESE